MLIDCDTCSVRGQACGECVVNLLFGEGPPVPVDPEEVAIRALADAGFEVTVLAREESRRRLRVVPGRRRDHHAA